MLRRPHWKFEKLAWGRGECIAGVDEVGTGAWAGPLFAGAVIFQNYVRAPLLCDSKLLREEQRTSAAEFLMAHCVWAVGRAEVAEINSLGLRPATFLAMRRAIDGLRVQPHSLIIDALRIPDISLPQQSVIRGDAQIASISAASIIAKYHRDQVMRDCDRVFPGYDFGSHKGYGTAQHRAALLQFGVTSLHRANFAPLREIIAQNH